jgi:hypothetical protein
MLEGEIQRLQDATDNIYSQTPSLVYGDGSSDERTDRWIPGPFGPSSDTFRAARAVLSIYGKRQMTELLQYRTRMQIGVRTFSQSSLAPPHANSTFFSPFQSCFPICHHCVPVCACASAWLRIPPQSTLRFSATAAADDPAVFSEFTESTLTNSSRVSVVVRGREVVEELLAAETLPVVDMAVVFLAGVLTGGLNSGRGSPRAARSLITLITSVEEVFTSASQHEVLIGICTYVPPLSVPRSLMRCVGRQFS